MPGLHPVLGDNELPAALRRRLVFGDREQIEALRAVDAKLRERDEVAASDGVEAEKLKRYRVEVTFESDETVEVWARDEDEAEAKAYDMIDGPDSDCWECHACAVEVKEKLKR